MTSLHTCLLASTDLPSVEAEFFKWFVIMSLAFLAIALAVALGVRSLIRKDTEHPQPFLVEGTPVSEPKKADDKQWGAIQRASLSRKEIYKQISDLDSRISKLEGQLGTR